MLRTYSCTAADTVKTDSIAAALNFLPKKPEEVPVGIVIEPVVHYHVPSSVVVCIGCGVPPVLVEHPICKAHHLSKRIKPAVKEGKEHQEKNQYPWQNGVEDAQDQPSKIKGFLTTVAKLRNAEPHKDVVGIKK